MEPIIEGSEPPTIAENINKPTLGLFENMPLDREFEKLNEIAKHVVDNVRDIGKLNESASVSMTGKASAADRAISKPL